MEKKNQWKAPLLVGVLGSFALFLLEFLVRRTRAEDLFGGYRFQAWSSEEFMQEVRINDLLEVGPLGLWYLHVQPPMLDATRFMLVLPEFLNGSTVSAETIDSRMYGTYCLLYGLLLAVVFAWGRSFTGSTRWAIAGSVVVGAYPGTIAMATLLDGTFLATVLTTIMLYLLYLSLRTRSSRLLNWWLLSLLVLSWTRVVFQIHILILVPLVVWLLYRYRIKRRSRVALGLSIILVGGLFALPVKQYVLFGTWATTTFAGNHQVEVVSYRPTAEELTAVEIPAKYLDNAERFVSGFNAPANVETNYVLSEVATDYYLREPFQVAKNLVWGLQMNVSQGLRFTHDYSILGAGPANIAADSLPWTPPSSRAVAAGFYLGALLGTIALLLYAFGIRGLMARARWYAGFLFVSGIILLTTMLANRYDWSESDRLKFYLVPFSLVLTVSSMAWARTKYLSGRGRSRPATDSKEAAAHAQRPLPS